MGASTEPPAYCYGYGGGFSSPCNMITNNPCKMETSLSSPSSPSSSHSSLSLEPLTSSPSSSASLAETFSYNHLLSTSYIDIPTPLDTPSSCSSHYSSLSLSKAPSHSTRKRPAVSKLEADSAQFDGVPMEPKRLCEMAALDGSRVQRGRESSSSYVDDEMLSSSHNSELIDGAIWRYGGAENAGLAGGDLDDVLDILLQEAEAVPTVAETIVESSPHSGYGSSGFTYKLHQCKEEVKEVIYSNPSKIHEEDPLTSLAHPGKREPSDGLQDMISREQRAGITAIGGGVWRELLRGQEKRANALSFCEELMRQISPSCATQQRKQQKNGLSTGSTRTWAGPTLMDIESALAMTGSPPSPTSSHYPPRSSPFGIPPPRSTYLCSIRDILKQETSSHLTSSPACKEETHVEEDDKICTWRRLQKRNHMEPRYTVKIRCEEDAVNDGYRWRKYGQKSIKNSPYPRSYYRCSSGKCNVKKQVERCSEDAGLLVVTYEGIHLHHRPTSILTSNNTCASPPPTCDPSLAPPLPTSHNSNNITTSPLLSHLLSTPHSHSSSP